METPPPRDEARHELPLRLVPVRPLTPRQITIVALVGAGYDYETIGRELGLSAGSIRNGVATIAALFPVVEGVTPYRLVSRYASERRSVQ